jgi:hypothetical protein
MAAGAYSGIVSPESTDDMLALAAEFRKYGPEAKRRLEDAGASQLTAAWTEELDARPGFSRQQESIVKAAPSVAVSGPSVIAATGGSGRLGFLTKQFEFGADREIYKSASFPSRSGTYQRRTRRQLPSISARGWLAYPAAGRWSTRVYKMYLQIVVLVAHNAAEGDVRG